MEEVVLEVGHPGDSGVNLLFQFREVANLVCMDCELLLQPIEEIFNRPIHRVVWGPESKSVTPPKDQLGHHGVVMDPQVVHRERSTVPLSSLSNLIQN